MLKSEARFFFLPMVVMDFRKYLHPVDRERGSFREPENPASKKEQNLLPFQQNRNLHYTRFIV